MRTIRDTKNTPKKYLKYAKEFGYAGQMMHIVVSVIIFY